MTDQDDAFSTSRGLFEALVGSMGAASTAALNHGELECHLQADGRGLLRQLYQDHLDLRATREQHLVEVVGADGVTRRYAETGHSRPLSTVFGIVHVTRLACRHKGAANLHPADAGLNLPEERYSHGLRRLAAVEATRGSFDDTLEAIDRATGTAVPKRQVEALTARAGADVEAFYAERDQPEADGDDVLVISVDGKGIVMRPDSLRPATAKAAAASTNKLTLRLSKGEKRDRKRLAEVGAVYDLAPVVRTADDVLATKGGEAPTTGPQGQGQVGDRQCGR